MKNLVKRKVLKLRTVTCHYMMGVCSTIKCLRGSLEALLEMLLGCYLFNLPFMIIFIEVGREIM